MNRERPDEELRIRAAELMGAEWFVCPSSMNQGRFLAFGRRTGWKCATGEEHQQYIGAFRIPDYLNDIAAAKDLVERAIDNGYSLKLNAWSGSLGTVWDCTFDRSDADWNDSDELPGRAITQAFIKAMEEEDE